MRAAVAALLALGALVVPGEAVAAVSCGSGPDNALAITATEFADGVAISRDGRAIEVTDDRTGSPVTCPEPPPTVRSIDSIDVTAAGEESFLYLDLARGRLGPGSTAEEERTSEIEVSAAWPSDPEVLAPDVINVLARGRGGDDDLTASGPREDDGSNVFELRVPVTFEGGPGRDLLAGGRAPDVLEGDGGNDLIFPGKGGDEIDCGSGGDRVIGAEPRDELRGCERVS